MATIRKGNKPVLLIVDVQVGVVERACEATRVIDTIAQLARRARAEAVPVIWVQHGDADLPRDSDAWQWVPELQPAADEMLIHKQFNSAFEDTALEASLSALGATHLVLAGAASNWCIRATAYAALERGYDLTLAADAHTTSSLNPEPGKTIAAADIIAELNVAMRWLSYPGRKNAATAAAAIDFTLPGQGS